MPPARELPVLPPGVPGPGAVLANKCRIEGLLGVGGMGVVLAAHHLHLDRRVAVKLLLPVLSHNEEVVKRFIREGRAAVKITSEHVVRVLDVATLDSGVPYMIMERLDGEDVDALLMRVGTLPIPHAVDIVLEACVALAEAHAEGIVHRDLKPSNLFLVRTPNGGDSVKVLDFGISKVADELGDDAPNITKTRTLLGSPFYMSPEQLRASRDVDARTDVWALGVILYELLAGRRPFEGETIAEIGASVFMREAPPIASLRPDIPRALADAIMACLEKDRAARFASVAELAFEAAPFGTERSRRALPRVASFAPRLLPPRRGPRVTTGSVTKDAMPPRGHGRILAVCAATACIGILFGAGGVAMRVRARRAQSEAAPTTSALVQGDPRSDAVVEPPSATTTTAGAPSIEGAQPTDTPPQDSATPSARRPGRARHPTAPSASATASAPAPAPSASHSDRFE